jgi:hypothetical protein
VNHFHNPLTNGGFTGIWGTSFLHGQSSTQWALAPQRTQSPGGYYSWSDVRGYYFKALTEPEPEIRETNFAQTFRGLGQLMHLVQDAAVPAHSRDDGHYIFSQYEDWVAESGEPFISSSSPIFFTGTVSNISSFIDTNQYSNPYPNPDLTISTTVGLSEYSNANFFSEGTILNGKFPYPAWSNMDEYDADIESGKKRTYLRKLGDGQRIEHVATGGWFYKHLPEGAKHWGLTLDDTVYADYAALLIPRAVGYSAGLLNYFFRGQLDAKFEGDNGIYITNNSSEAMNGAFRLYYDASNGQRKPVTDDPWTLSLAAGAASARQTFTPPSDVQHPATYTLVFQGRMGAEDGAVAGKVLKNEANYLFIIEETAEILDPPVLKTSSPEEKFWAWDYVAGPEATRVGHPRQRLSGKFVLHGSAYIEKIASVFMDGPAKIYLDGVLIDPSTWRGDPLHIPQTWAIEPDVTQSPIIDSYNTLGATLTVQLSDGKLFDSTPVGFRFATFRAGHGVSCATPCVTPAYYYATGYGQIQVSIRPSYSIVSIGGHPIDEEKLRSSIYGYYCEPQEPLSHLEPSSVTIPLNQYCYGSGIDGGTSGFVLFLQTGYVTTDPGIDYFNVTNMTVSASMQYHTQPDEVERLRVIGLEPIDFTVTLH